MSGGGAPSSSTVVQSNIPDWLRAPVETVVGGAMKELVSTEPDAAGNLQVTGVKPFTPYSTNVNDYFAAASPLQQQAYGNVANMQVPGQLGGATQLATQAGLGGLSVAPQAAGLAGQQAGLGGQYMQMATNPYATQAFMSPYMQNVVDVQQQQAQRQADIANQAMKAQFGRSGAFGGGRQGIAQAQANADLMRAKQGIQATGLQSAFGQAQQAQQFGSQLGLQGLQGAQQGLQNVLGAYNLVGQQGANLANIGGQQLAAQKDIIGMQAQYGGQQQQAEQAKINQAIQNYAQQVENPMQRLTALNTLIRGNLMPGQTTTQYQAAAPAASQIAGLGLGALGLSKMMAKGGKVEEPKRMATGGIPSINRKVLLNPDSVSLPQVQQGVKNGAISDLIGIPVALQKQEAQQSAAAMQNAPNPNRPTFAQQALSGIPQLQSNLPTRMAGGGIVAFDEGGSVGLGDQLAQLLGNSPGQPEVYSALARMFPGAIKDIMEHKAAGLPAKEAADIRAKYMQEMGADTDKYYSDLGGRLESLYAPGDAEKEKGAAFLQAGAAMMQPGMNFAQGLGQAGSVLGQKYSQIAKEESAAKRALGQAQLSLEDAKRKERMALRTGATAAVADARKEATEAARDELKRRELLVNMLTRGMTATKPLKAAGSGGPDRTKLPEQLAAAAIAARQNPTPENIARYESLKEAATLWRTSDIGPERVGAAGFGPSMTRERLIAEAVKNIEMGMIEHPLSNALGKAKVAVGKAKTPEEQEAAMAELGRIQALIRQNVASQIPEVAPNRPAAPARAPTPAGPAPLPNLTPGMDNTTKPGGVSVSGWGN